MGKPVAFALHCVALHNTSKSVSIAVDLISIKKPLMGFG
ncbi:MAG: hypothetical protein RL748_3129 [Pseudomonadota bacterium]|jgi:hypothetical protein